MAAVSEGAYRVVVTREEGHWLAGGRAHTVYARSLPTLDQAAREGVVPAADLPDEAMPGLPLKYDHRTGGRGSEFTALEVRQLRRQEYGRPCRRTGRARGRHLILVEHPGRSIRWSYRIKGVFTHVPDLAHMLKVLARNLTGTRRGTSPPAS